MKIASIIYTSYASFWYLVSESENAIWFACGVLTTLVVKLLLNI